MAITINGSTGITSTEIADSTEASLKSGRKNLIINGAMQVAQRGTSVANVGRNLVETVDRFMNNHDHNYYTNVLSEQSTDAPDGFSHSHKVSVTGVTGTISASSFLQPFQARLENNILTPLSSGTSSAKEMTLSFWVKSNDTGTKSVDVYYQVASGWTGDQAKNKAFTINSADTWEKKVLTFPANTTITNTATNPEVTTHGMTIWWWMSAGSAHSSGTEQSSWGPLVTQNRAAGVSNNATTGTYYQITGVQLEVGSVATDFEHRSYGEELALCQRYYQLLGGVPYAAVGFGKIYAAGQTAMAFVPFITEMRAPPAVAEKGNGLIVTDRVSYDSSVTSISSANISTNCLYARFNTGTTHTDRHPVIIACRNGTLGWLELKAEL